MGTEVSAELIARARHDRAAFGDLYVFYVRRVYAYCLAHTGHREQAEDLTSATFEHALRALDRYEDRGARFSTWLLQIAANTLVEHIRRERRIMLVDDTSLRTIVDDCVPDEITDPAQWVERWEEADRLQRQLASLSMDQRTVLRLRYWDDLSPRDIAASVGRTEMATRQFLHRSLAALRQNIEDSVEDDRPQARAAGPIDQRRRRSVGAPVIGPRPSDTPKRTGRVEPAG